MTMNGTGPGLHPGRPAGSGLGQARGGDAGEVAERERAVVAAQLGRLPRAMRAVAHQCPCGLPDVVETAPRLADGTPFPTLYYLTCPRASAAIGRLEAAGVMRELTDRVRSEPALAAGYQSAHAAYLRRRAELGEVPEIAGISAGGMPNRVKCLHVLVAHALAAGPGVNPLGDEALAALPPWWAAGPCVTAGPAAEAAVDPAAAAVLAAARSDGHPGSTAGPSGAAARSDAGPGVTAEAPAAENAAARSEAP